VILSKRERHIGVVAVAVFCLLILDHFALTPFFVQRAYMATESARLEEELARATLLFAREERMIRTWDSMIEGGLKGDPAEAESAALRALQDWAQQSGLTLGSLNPERVPQSEDLREIQFAAVGSGPMRAVSRFLWMLETAELPLRIKRLQLGSRTDGVDDLSMTLTVTALYLAPDAETTQGETR
jgi:hypothetical protein